MNEVILPYPHAGIQTVRKQAKRFNWLSAGRRWRKTTSVMSIAVEAALAGQAIIWGAPTFDQVRIGWAETKHAAAKVATFTQQRMEAVFPSGGVILYRSLDDPDNARGHTADGLIIDEVGDVKEEAYYEVLRPMLVDTNGWAWMVGTPKGRNWFWREHHNARDREDSMSWQAPTMGCEVVDGTLTRKPHPLENPDIDWAEVVNLYQSMPEDLFRQEILAEFIEREGTVFRNLDAVCVLEPVPASDHAGHRIVCGVDWGKQSDFTVISVMCGDCKEEIYIDRFNQIDWAFQYGRLESIFKAYNIKSGLVETNSIGSPGFEALQRAGLYVKAFDTTATSKPQLIESFALGIERAELLLLKNETARGELEAYERTVSATTGRSQYSAPQGMHDDTVIARALAAREMETSGTIVLWSV